MDDPEKTGASSLQGMSGREDIKRGFYVSEGGVTVVPKNARLN